MIPVRRLERSKAPNRGCSSSAMNMVGAMDRQETSQAALGPYPYIGPS
jgi:hypothetical protein